MRSSSICPCIAHRLEEWSDSLLGEFESREMLTDSALGLASDHPERYVQHLRKNRLHDGAHGHPLIQNPIVGTRHGGDISVTLALGASRPLSNSLTDSLSRL